MKNNIIKEIKLLYVEDNEELREEMHEILAYYFQNISLAKNGEEGLELYKQELNSGRAFDIVISDIEMPKMDGVLMCKKIKEIKSNQIVVLLSAYDTKEYLKEAIHLGVDKFIVKPVVDACDFISSLISLSEKALAELEYKKKNFLLEQKNKIIDENVLMTVLDLNGEVVEISNAYLEFTGFEKEEVIGKHHSIFKNENEEYWLNATINSLYDYNNQKIGYTAIVQDITSTKR